MKIMRRDFLSLALSTSGVACRERSTNEHNLKFEKLAIDDRRTYQQFEGFGTALVSWVPELVKYYQSDEFLNFYLKDLGASVLRVDLHEGTVPERTRWQDISHQDFRLADPAGARGRVFVEAAERLTRATSESFKVIASVWSPPAWMKENRTTGNGGTRADGFALSMEELEEPFAQSRKGDQTQRRHQLLHHNRLRPDRYQHLAKSLVEWTRLYASRGAPLFGLSAQNEPRFSHWFESCTYTPVELARLYRVIIDMFETEGVELPRLFAPETMSHDSQGNRLYLKELFRDDKVERHISVVATHGYLDGYTADKDPESPAKVKALAAPMGKAVWLTEGGTGEHNWPRPLHFLGVSMMNALLHGEVSLIAPWQCVGQHPSEHDLATPSESTKKTYVAAQFFRHIRPGMQRVHVDQPKNATASCVAFLEFLTNRGVIVVINRGDQPFSLDVQLGDKNRHIESVYVTDASRNHQPLGRESKHSLLIPKSSVVSITFDRTPV